MKSENIKWEKGWSTDKETYWLESINQIIEYGTWKVYEYKEEGELLLVNTSSYRHLYDCLRDEEWRNSLSDEEYYDLAKPNIPHDFPGL